MVIGFSAGFALPDSSAAALVAVQQSLDPTKVAVINEAVSASVLVSTVGHLIGTIILGLALWRAHTVPSWAAILLAISQPIHLASVMLGNRPLDLAGWGGTAVGFCSSWLGAAAHDQ